MTPNKSLLGAVVIVLLFAAFLTAYEMEQPSHHNLRHPRPRICPRHWGSQHQHALRCTPHHQMRGGGLIVILAGGHVGCFELFGTERVCAILDLEGKTVAIPDLHTGRSPASSAWRPTCA
jgi:hypothetical protein